MLTMKWEYMTLMLPASGFILGGKIDGQPEPAAAAPAAAPASPAAAPAPAAPASPAPAA